MRDYKRIDSYLNILAKDIYPQPSGSDEHSALAKKAIDYWMSRMTTCKSVLDVGCGEAFCQPLFEKWDVQYEGICLGEDYIIARDSDRTVKKMDYHFLEYEDKSFDFIFSRHSLEHSPMPLLALMEWARVSKSWLGLILPAPEHYTYTGLNHYSVMNHEQIENLLARAGWKILWNDIDYRIQDISDENPQGVSIPHEYWYMCERLGI